MQAPDIKTKLTDLEVRIEAQKVLIVALIAIGGDKAEEACVAVRDAVVVQSADIARHIDQILSSIHRPDRKHQ